MDYGFDERIKETMAFEFSICIPAWNKAKYLKTTLDSIICQIDDDIKDKIEICISDDASQDNT
ncbi:MAG: glycosyltransferase, partial [Elusimicrobiota bacterium]|nr:glycosyltransferase [Elusimicrobiota bacterium]